MAETKTYHIDDFFLDQGLMSRMEHKRVWNFYKRFCLEMDNYYGESHWILLCHAAFPVILTPDLLYKLWMNFRVYPDKENPKKVTQAIPFVAVSDVLLSGLCKEVGFEQYEIPANIRFSLLEWLKKDPRFCDQKPTKQEEGEKKEALDRLKELAEFLNVYLEDSLKGNDPRTLQYREAQEWAITSYLQPETAIRKMYDDFLKANKNQNKRKQLRLNRAIEQLQQQYSLRVQVNPDADQTKKLQHLLEYSRGKKNLLMGKNEEAITAFRKLPSLKNKAKTSSASIKQTLAFPSVIAGENIYQKPTDAYDGEQIYALLIGINEYEFLPDLNGCVNDIHAVSEYLREFHNEKDLRILKLLNKDASYQNIVDSFRKHFRRARSEDVILIYFSGHTQMVKPHPELADLFLGGEEAGFAAHDSSRDGKNVLLSLEFLALLSESLRDDRNPNAFQSPRIVVIIDSHYSEFLAKKPELYSFELKEIEYTDHPRPLSSYLESYYTDMWEKEGRLFLPNSSFIVLGAVQGKAMAYEKDGHGLFTKSLLDVLHLFKGKISYTQLFSQARSLTRGRKDQTPVMMVNGNFDSNRGFLDKELDKHGLAERIQIYYNPKEGWILGGGALHGFSQDEIIKVEGDEAESFYFEISKLKLEEANIKLQEKSEHERLNKQGIYTVELPIYPMGAIYAEAHLHDFLNLLNLNMRLVKDKQDADWVISEEEEIYSLAYPHKEEVFLNMRQEELEKNLKQIALWRWLKYLENPGLDFESDRLEIRLEKELLDGKAQELSPEKNVLDISLEQNERFHLNISLLNKTDQEIYVCLLVLTSNFGIAVMFNEAVPPATAIKLNKKALSFYIQEGKEQEEELIKLIYSEDKINESLLERPDLNIFTAEELRPTR